MRKAISIALLTLMITAAAVAKDKRQYLTGRLMDVRTQEISAAETKKPESRESLATVRLGAASTPTMLTRYSLILSTDAEIFYLSLDRLAHDYQPDLKIDMETKFRALDADNAELIDGKGKKFTVEILRRVTRNAPTLKAPPRAEAATPTK